MVIINIDSGQALMTLKGHADCVKSILYFAEKDKLLSASWDKTLKVWDLKTGEEKKTLTGHTDWVMCLIPVSKNQVVSGSVDDTIKFWDIDDFI